MVYLIMPGVCLLCTFLVYFLLKLTEETYYRSHKLISTVTRYLWNFEGSRFDAKLTKRRLKVLLPITVPCGCFYNFSEMAHLEFYLHVATTTTDGVLFA